MQIPLAQTFHQLMVENKSRSRANTLDMPPVAAAEAPQEALTRDRRNTDGDDSAKVEHSAIAIMIAAHCCLNT